MIYWQGQRLHLERADVHDRDECRLFRLLVAISFTVHTVACCYWLVKEVTHTQTYTSCRQ